MDWTNVRQKYHAGLSGNFSAYGKTEFSAVTKNGHCVNQGISPRARVKIPLWQKYGWGYKFSYKRPTCAVYFLNWTHLLL